MREDGSGAKRITDRVAGRPDFLGGFYYILDEKRMFLSNELGNEAYILESEPSLYEAKEQRYRKIVFHDGFGDKQVIGRRTYHVAPDGKHLAYNLLRRDGLIMVICTLKREEDCYETEDYRILNPQGPSSEDDADVRGWANSGSLCEFKSFAEGGRSFLFVSNAEGGNIDQFKRNFATGEITRMTYHSDWDEDGAMSADGNLLVCASWRGMRQLEGINAVPVAPPLLSQNVSAVIAVHYVSSYYGFINDLQPWLLTQEGDTKSHPMGQPLSPYRGGEIITVNNLAGQPMWHPYQNKVLLQERLLTPPPQNANERIKEKGLAPNRITVAEIGVTPETPLAPVETTLGEWALLPEMYRAAVDFQGEHKIAGRFGGAAVLSIKGNLFDADHSVAYYNYCADGDRILNGTESVKGSPADLLWKQDLQVTNGVGERIGSAKIALHFVRKLPEQPRDVPPMRLSGTAETEWEGRKFKGFPTFGAKTDAFPRATPLMISIEVEDTLNVYITAGYGNDVRPVFGAIVQYRDQTVQTDLMGIARFPLSGNGTISASAGENFLPSKTEFII